MCLLKTFLSANIVNVFGNRQKIVSLQATKVRFLRFFQYLFDFAKNVTKFVSWKERKDKETQNFYH